MKRGSLPLENLIVVTILIVIGLLIVFAFLAPQGLVNEVAKKSGSIVNSIPWLKQDIPSAGLSRDEAMVTAFNELVKFLESNQKLEAGARSACVHEFKYWPKDFKEHTIELSRNRLGETFVQLRNARKQIVESKLIPSVEVCVVGGALRENVIAYDGTAATKLDNGVPKLISPRSNSNGLTDENVQLAAYLFYTNWIKDFGESFNPQVSTFRTEGKRLYGPDYTDLERVVIDGPNSMILNDKPAGKEDAGWLYIPEAGKVCVIRTFGGDDCCNADESGLDNACFVNGGTCYGFADDTIYTSKMLNCDSTSLSK